MSVNASLSWLSAELKEVKNNPACRESSSYAPRRALRGKDFSQKPYEFDRRSISNLTFNAFLIKSSCVGL
jgi:hypothetical protein